METHSVRRGVRLVLLACWMVVAGCGGKGSSRAQTPDPPSAVSALAKMGQLATDPIAQMSMTFDGNPAQEEIREKIDMALLMYGMDVNNVNRGSAGRTLVALRKERGLSEMAIL